LVEAQDSVFEENKENKLVNGFFCSFYNPGAMTTSINPEDSREDSRDNSREEPSTAYSVQEEVKKRSFQLKETGLSSKQTYKDIKSEGRQLMEQSSVNTPSFIQT